MAYYVPTCRALVASYPESLSYVIHVHLSPPVPVLGEASLPDGGHDVVVRTVPAAEG